MSRPDYVLVVEDDREMAELLVSALSSERYPTKAAVHGRQALEIVAEHLPSLILLDMMMPVMDGWSFVREFRARYGPAVPIVVITAAEYPDRRALEVGANEFLPKPFDLQDLLNTAARFVPDRAGPDLSSRRR